MKLCEALNLYVFTLLKWKIKTKIISPESAPTSRK